MPPGIPGPVVATSATGEQLAMGPPGPPGTSLPAGAGGQVLFTANGVPTWKSLTGDVTSSPTVPGDTTVVAIDGESLPSPVGAQGLLTSTGSSLLWSPGGWATALDLDLTAQGNHSFATDGNYTFAGMTWTKINSANELTHAQLVASAGLELAPNTSCSYAFNAHTAPGLFLPFNQIAVMAGMDWNTQIRLWLQISAISTNSNSNDYVCFGVEHNDVTTLAYQAHFSNGNAGGTYPQVGIVFNSTQDAIVGAFATPIWTTATFALDIRRGIAGSSAVLYGASGAPGASWPTAGSLRPLSDADGQANGGQGFVHYALGNAVTSWGIFLGAASSSVCTATISRIRIDYR